MHRRRTADDRGVRLVSDFVAFVNGWCCPWSDVDQQQRHRYGAHREPRATTRQPRPLRLRAIRIAAIVDDGGPVSAHASAQQRLRAVESFSGRLVV